MTSVLLKGTILGGIVLFLWSMLAWAVLPLHTSTLLSFANEEAMTQALIATAPKSGNYLLPAERLNTQGMTADQIKTAQQAAMDRMMKGPTMFAAVRLGPVGSMASYYGAQVLTQFVCAFLATLLLLPAKALSYWGRVAFLVGIALAGGVACYIPEWVWWSFSSAYTTANFVDLLVGFFLAGLVIAKVVK